MEAIMQSANWNLSAGLYAGVADDWRVLVVEADTRHPGVFYVGRYPYDEQGDALHPDAPLISAVWDRHSPGARQISEREKRFAHFMVTTLVEPAFAVRHA
jgi:hypothetical protein